MRPCDPRLRTLSSTRLGFAVPKALLSAASWLVLTWQFDVRGTVDWPVLGFTPVVTNTFSNPTCVTHAGDGSQRLFVMEQVGRVWIVQGGSVLPQPFLDITTRVLRAGPEQGLLGLAFPPGFSARSHFYVDYTRQTDGAVVISRFQVSTNSNLADATSEQIVLVIPKAYNYHNGGQLAFGPDGYLYIGVGDGGPEGDGLNNGQNSHTLLGKLLRIDVESGVSPYAVPASNPFVGNTNYLPEIWALGLRNPWRFSFDRVTGDLYIGDVGQGRFEEIDFQPAVFAGGQNYGWRIMEGPSNFNVPPGFTNFSGLTPPVAWYDHLTLPTDAQGSVTGGYVYRGPSEPRMDGVYFYGDWVCGWIWGLKQTGANWQSFPLLTPPSPLSHMWISTFGEDEQGRLYLADYYPGRIYQIQDTHQVWTPTFAPSGGTIASNTVLVGCATPNAVIHYTTNGIDPTGADPGVVSGQFITVATGTNQIRAFRSDLLPSSVATTTFTLKVATPAFIPAQGPITNGTIMTLATTTPGATIYYTTNGTTPGTSSLLYTGPFPLNGGLTLKAIGVETGYSNSTVQSVSYALAHVATPAFSPSAGPLTTATSISMSCTTPGALIRYTLDGTSPGDSSPVYSQPVPLSVPTTVKAIAFATNWGPSSVQSAFFGFLTLESRVVTTFVGNSTAGSSNGVGRAAQFSNPEGICIDTAGDLYVADAGNNVVRKVTPLGEVTTFAGTGTAGSQDGPRTNAQFSGPSSVCIDPAGNVYVADRNNCYRIRKIDTSGNVTTLASLQPCYLGPTLWQVEVDPAGNIFAGSRGNIVKIMPNGSFAPFAGPGTLAGQGWSLDGIGVGLDAATNVYAITQYRIWKIAPDGSTQLWAGSSDPYFGSGFSDGPRLLALFQGPLDAAVDSATNIFVTDSVRIRRVRPDGQVTTVAGTGVGGYNNGPSSTAQFNGAGGLCVDRNGNIYVADSGNNCIRKIAPDTAGIGIADDWQLEHFGYIGIDPQGDPDHDGMSDFAEFWAGTDPLDPNSALLIESGPLVTNGHVQIRWQTVAGKTYAVRFSSDLISWSDLGSPIQGDGSIASVTDPAAISQAGQRYYRVALTGL